MLSSGERNVSKIWKLITAFGIIIHHPLKLPATVKLISRKPTDLRVSNFKSKNIKGPGKKKLSPFRFKILALCSFAVPNIYHCKVFRL